MPAKKKRRDGGFDSVAWSLWKSEQEFLIGGLRVERRSKSLMTKLRGETPEARRGKGMAIKNARLGFGSSLRCPYGCQIEIDDKGGVLITYVSPDCDEHTNLSENKYVIEIEDARPTVPQLDLSSAPESRSYETYDMSPRKGLGGVYRRECGCLYRVEARNFYGDPTLVGVCVGYCTNCRKDRRDGSDY